MNRYPDMGNVDLFAALATRLDVPVEDLTLATGSVGLIYQVLQAFCDPADEVVHAWRSFEAYPIAVTAAAATSVRVPVTATGEHDLEAMRSEEHTSELQSLMRISYAVFCLKKKNKRYNQTPQKIEE